MRCKATQDRLATNVVDMGRWYGKTNRLWESILGVGYSSDEV